MTSPPSDSDDLDRAPQDRLALSGLTGPKGCEEEFHLVPAGPRGGGHLDAEMGPGAGLHLVPQAGFLALTVEPRREHEAVFAGTPQRRRPVPRARVLEPEAHDRFVPGADRGGNLPADDLHGPRPPRRLPRDLRGR